LISLISWKYQLLAVSKPKLLIVDELGYLPLEPDAAHLFFQLVTYVAFSSSPSRTLYGARGSSLIGMFKARLGVRDLSSLGRGD
jgi:hypothetical protein